MPIKWVLYLHFMAIIKELNFSLREPENGLTRKSDFLGDNAWPSGITP